ncbi:MAG: DUF1499 domain-containing protein [Alphaproteobacteria bacterium]|nr:DUF1499 domain-containing protein [Alphaproteobacteria bacterium]
MSGEQSESSARPHIFFETLVRPSSSNHWLVAPQGFPGNPDETAPGYPVPVERLQNAFEDVIGALKSVRQVNRDGGLTRYVDKTALFHFKDDIRVQFLSQVPGNSSLAMYSASRIGFLDLGANRRRLQRWLGLLSDRLA